MTAWSNGRVMMGVLRDVSRSVWVSPRVLPDISTYPSCAILRLMREGIGAWRFDMGVCGGGVVDAGVSAGARTGVSVGACAGAGGTRAGAGAVTMRTGVGTGT